MLSGDPWVLGHLASIGGRGNTQAGRDFASRVRGGGGSLTVVCDVCGSSRFAETLSGIYYLYSKSLEQLGKRGRHECQPCSRKEASKARAATVAADPTWGERFSSSVRQGMSNMSPESRASWASNYTESMKSVWASMTPEDRRRGVVHQWESLSEEAKTARALKIGRWAKNFWSSLTPAERTAHVEKCVKGLPRSGASERFKDALIAAGLYDGFRSEVGVAGYIVDEADDSRKIAIEFFGDYYHCNPRIYKPDFYNTTLQMTAAEKWAYDRRRFGAFYASGYVVLVIWESEWNSSPLRSLDKVRRLLATKQTSKL